MGRVARRKSLITCPKKTSECLPYRCTIEGDYSPPCQSQEENTEGVKEKTNSNKIQEKCDSDYLSVSKF